LAAVSQFSDGACHEDAASRAFEARGRVDEQLFE
jgi:hypothetical protein